MPVLSFKGKTAVETYHHIVPHHTLEFDKKLSCLGEGEEPSLDGNLIIEGDNLLALKALLPTHAGRIKCVYIDPPYNTGNEGWVYNDNLTQPQFKEWIGRTVGKEGEDACRHDKWCCMMYPRLMLLRELLHDDGAIFVSIDDNEVAHLRLLMDWVFGESNFVASIIWEKVYSPKSTAKYFSENHDFIVVYAKRKENWERGLLPRGVEQDARYSNPDDDPRGDWKPGDLSARNYYSKGTYRIECPGGRVIEGPPQGSYWRVSPEKLKTLDADRRIWWGEDRKQTPSIKRFLAEVKQGLVPETIWTYREVGHTQDAKKEYLEILSGIEVFTTPKPTALIRRIISLATEPDDIILDSFAGSGTTGQAALQQNREDVRATLQNFRSASERLESLAFTLDELAGENREDINLLIKEIRSTVVQVRTATEKIDRLVSENAGDVAITIDNLHATTANARDFSETIADEPWRLIWRTRQPEKKALEEKEDKSIAR